MRRALQMSIVSGLVLGVTSCELLPVGVAHNGSQPALDSGPHFESDPGATSEGTELEEKDAGSKLVDSGFDRSRDAGSQPPGTGDADRTDSGTPSHDAGPSIGDADQDAGTLARDAGSSADAGATPSLPNFSFFVTSMVRMLELAKNDQGFGGDLRFGETGEGAGLRGADKICATIAEMSMPGSSAKSWRAFLSTAGIDGPAVNAIDRIGSGPWYDRKGRLVANNVSELLNARPLNADSVIKDDLPNEDGIPNHRPDPVAPAVDNHDTLTGSDAQGKLFSKTATCQDWTTSDGSSANGKPQIGHSWPRGGGGGGTGAGSAHWISAHNEPGCGRQINLSNDVPSAPGNGVGAGGGYGGLFCFALSP
jgi:hypothetical protein